MELSQRTLQARGVCDLRLPNAGVAYGIIVFFAFYIGKDVGAHTLNLPHIAMHVLAGSCVYGGIVVIYNLVRKKK